MYLGKNKFRVLQSNDEISLATNSIKGKLQKH